MLNFDNFSGIFADFQTAIAQHRHACGIIAAILQALHALEELVANVVG
jgi:hypothetical protein